MYMHIYILNVYIYINIYIYIYAYAYIHIKYVYIYVYICICVYKQIHKCTQKVPPLVIEQTLSPHLVVNDIYIYIYIYIPDGTDGIPSFSGKWNSICLNIYGCIYMYVTDI
jgi:hypothetical protein